MALKRVSCLFGSHQPDRHKVRHDGHNFNGRCKHCGKRIIRKGPKNWRAAPKEPEEHSV